MAMDRLERALRKQIDELEREGRRKGAESVVVGVVPPEGNRGPRYLLAGEGDRPFLRMNSNGYLGLALRDEVRRSEETIVDEFGSGPGAVRFISGTYVSHVALEQELASFHGRQAGILFSSAYAAVMGTLPPLVTAETAVISDELNHNCIINAIRLARPPLRKVYPHNDLGALAAALEEAAGSSRRAIVVTDGIFSMRGDHAPLAEIRALADRFDERFEENVVLVVDDSHGVGALGRTGRGTEEHTGATSDILIATLGKALGVNGGYVVGGETLVEYLRETSPFYIYSNPITPAEAAAASASSTRSRGARCSRTCAR
jgi:glycine C-acetyltransferase